MEQTRHEFVKVIQKRYNEHCKIKGIEPTIEGFAVYIVNRRIVTDLTINRFLVIDLYPHLLAENMNIKQATIWDLEARVGLKFASIKNIIKRYQKLFRRKDRVIPNS